MQRSDAGVLITGTDTGVGKTVQAARLIEHLGECHWRVGAYKPVASGSCPPGESDAEILRAALPTSWPLERVCPQTFEAALAPPVAASRQQTVVDEELLIEGYRWWRKQVDFVVVEGAGGCLSPISQRMTVLDLGLKLELPWVVVAANRLGVVNHTLLTLAVAASHDIAVHGVVLNQLPATVNTDDESLDTNLQLLRDFVRDVPVVSCITQLVPSTTDQP